MLNLIKNELIKLFNKKTIYVMVILVILLSILTMYIS
ncbi:MAG: ABC transporter permease, partial [Clostridiales bacterium]|nr:ABC transporter permease [Clostridiales bacterium]